MENSYIMHGQSSLLGEIQAVWGRRKWLILSVFIIPFACVISLIMAMPDIYQAKATILVQQESIGDSTDSYAAKQLDSRLQTISENIFSRKRLQDLITQFGLYPELSELNSPAVVIERMRKDLRMERKTDEFLRAQDTTVAFTLSYQGWNPEVVAEVTNRIASMYVEENEKLRPRKRVYNAPVAAVVDPLLVLKQELAQLRTLYSEKYPDVVRLKEEIIALQRQEEELFSSRMVKPRVRPKISNNSTNKLITNADKQFRIVDSAIVPTTPVAPNRNRLILVGLIMVLGLTGIVVFVAEQFDTSFHRPDDLGGFTSMPILAGISPILTHADVWRLRFQFSCIGLLVVLMTVLLVNGSHYLGSASSQLVWLLAQRGI